VARNQRRTSTIANHLVQQSLALGLKPPAVAMPTPASGMFTQWRKGRLHSHLIVNSGIPRLKAPKLPCSYGHTRSLKPAAERSRSFKTITGVGKCLVDERRRCPGLLKLYSGTVYGCPVLDLVKLILVYQLQTSQQQFIRTSHSPQAQRNPTVRSHQIGCPCTNRPIRLRPFA